MISKALRGLLAVAIWASALAQAEPRLRYVVIVTRHGVRAPTWENARLNQYSAEPWPEWGVPPAHLTPRGRTLMQLMGAYYREWFSSQGLLQALGCGDAGKVYIWADNDQRTIETGRALAESVLPGCEVKVHALAEGENDPLFDPISAGLVKPDAETAEAAVRKKLGADPSKFLEKYRAAFDTLQKVLSGGGKPARLVDEGGLQIAFSKNGKSIDLTGPLRTASTFTENLLLEYANGFSGKNLGWGRLSEESLHQVLELHGVYADLMRRTPYLARARGSNLLSHVLRSLQQSMTGQKTDGALGQPGDAALIISGHDTNLSNISGMLDLTWKLPGYQTDETPPGGALVFSLWRETSSGAYSVRTQFLAQTLDQMRNRTPLTKAAPPAIQDVPISACGPSAPKAGCTWSTFVDVITKATERRRIP